MNQINGTVDNFKQVLVCEDSQEGIFTGIYEAYAGKYPLETVSLAVGGQEEMQLFCVYHSIAADSGKAARVAGTIQRLAGDEVYRSLCVALSSADAQKAQAVFQTVVRIVQSPHTAGRVLERLAEEPVHKVFALSRRVQNEIHHLREFVRFWELENGVLYSSIGPYNDVVMYLMPHFADRFPLENFMIYDEGRRLLGVHPAGQQWYMIREIQVDEALLNSSEGEEKHRELFRYFCHKIAIKERENLNLQRNMLPLRFRNYMVEFDDTEKSGPAKN